MRLISTINKSLGFKAKVYDNKEWGEFIVKFYDENGNHLEHSNYFTDCKEDAIDTAHLVLNSMCDKMAV
jgi:predicted SAM-dependent methyltransferase